MTDRIQRILDFLQATPDDNFLKHALALEYIKLNEPGKARELFESILTGNPDYVGSYYHLAKLLEQIGEKETALSWYEKGMTAAKKAGDNHAYNELQNAYEDLAY